VQELENSYTQSLRRDQQRNFKKTVVTQFQFLYAVLGNITNYIQAGTSQVTRPHMTRVSSRKPRRAKLPRAKSHLTRAPYRKVTFKETTIPSPTREDSNSAPPKLGVDPYGDQSSDSSFGGYSQSLTSFLEEFQDETTDTSGEFAPSHSSTTTNEPNLRANRLSPPAATYISHELSSQNVMASFNQASALDEVERYSYAHETESKLKIRCPALSTGCSNTELTYDSSSAYTPILWDPRQPLCDTSVSITPKKELSDNESTETFVSDDECIDIIKEQLCPITQSENTPAALLNSLSDPSNQISQTYDYSIPNILPTLKFCEKSQIQQGRYISLRNLQAVAVDNLYLEIPADHTLQYSQLLCKVGLFSIVKNL
jgi:hypothetical protein